MAYGIIFDLDGTLADTIDDLKTAINGMLSILGYESRTKFEIINFINRGSRELVRRSLPTAVQTENFIIDSALNIYEQEYEKCYCEKTALFPGIKEAVDALKAQKFKIGVLSNKQDVFVKTIIYKLFGTDTFDFVMGKTNLPHKPDPSSAIVVAKELGVKPNKCIFVGDSDVDMQTAQNADMRSIGVSWGYRKPELLTQNGASYIAETPEELIVHANELVRIIKMERKLNRKKMFKKSPAPQPETSEANKEPAVEEPIEITVSPAAKVPTEIKKEPSLEEKTAELTVSVKPIATAEQAPAEQLTISPEPVESTENTENEENKENTEIVPPTKEPTTPTVTDTQTEKADSEKPKDDTKE